MPSPAAPTFPASARAPRSPVQRTGRRTGRAALRGALMLAAALMVGCQTPQSPTYVARTGQPAAEVDYYRELAPGQNALRRITDPAQIPDFTEAFSDLERLDEAAANSLSYLAKPSARRFFPVSGISHDEVVRSLEAFRELIASGDDPATLNRKLRERFDVYTSVGCDDRGTVLFTGYYVPVFDAALERGGPHQYPLHRLPPNHVKDEITGETLGLRQPDGSVDARYPDRDGLLNSGMLDGLEIAWFRTPMEAYVASVQGSAILRLPDGRRHDIMYAGSNGHDYTAIAAQMIADGKIRRDELNLDRLLRHFTENPGDYDHYAGFNRRYIFFQESPPGGPFGSLNEPVIAMRTIATDKSIFPRGALCLIETKLPGEGGRGEAPYSGFVLDQDTGGAIRAPGRCDVFMGVGDEAGQRAGHTLAEGRLYYLILRR